MLSIFLVSVIAQYPQHRIFEQPNLRRLNGGADIPTYLEFAPSSGAGLPVISHHNTALCDALAAEVPTWSTAVDGGAGNWCMGGDGLAVTGSEVTFALVGSPAVVTTPVCPSGLDCLAATGQPVQALQLTSTTATAATAARASGTGAMTACSWHASADDGQKFILTNMTADSVAGHGWRIELLSAGTYRMVGSNGSALTILTPAGSTLGAPTLVCITHGAGSAPLRPYSDGVAGTASASYTQNSVTAKPTINGVNGVSNTGGGLNLLGAFYVDQELRAAQIAAIARRVLADVPKAVINGGSSYVDLTYSRTGSMFCSRSDNTGSIIPANRPCIARNGILNEGAATNVLLRTREFDNAAWSVGGVNAATVTANYGSAPDGTKTAERLQFQACPVLLSNSLIRNVTGTTIAPNRTVSWYVRATPGGTTTDGGTLSMWQSGVTSTFSTCVFPALDGTGERSIDGGSPWVRCLNSYTSAGSNFDYLGCVNDPVSRPGTYDTGAADVLVSSAQAEAGSVATSYIPTTSAAATMGASLSSIAGLTPTRFDQGCLATNLVPQYASEYLAVTGGLVGLEQNTVLVQSVANAGGLWAYVGSAQSVQVTRPVTALEHRALIIWSPSTVTLTVNGVSGTGAGTGGTFNTLRIGNYSNANPFPGRYSEIQYDPRPTRCR